MKKKSKRYQLILEGLKNKNFKSTEEKIKEIKKNSNTKFEESIDLSFKVNLKKIKEDNSIIRTVLELPNGNGKKYRVAVLCDDSKLSEAKKSGADIVGSEDLLNKISSKEIKFDQLDSTPSMMPKIGKLGKFWVQKA